MKIIKFLKEKEKKNKEYVKEIHEVQKKYGKYKSKPKRFMVELPFFVLLIMTIMTIAPMYAFQKVILQNEYIVNTEETKSKFLSEFDEIRFCEEVEDYTEKKECIVVLMGSLDLHLTSYIASNIAYHYSVENNDVELAKSILNNIKKLNTSRHYQDFNADISANIAFNILENSIIGKVYNKVSTPEMKMQYNVIEKKSEMLKELEDNIRKDHDLHNYKAVIN